MLGLGQKYAAGALLRPRYAGLPALPIPSDASETFKVLALRFPFFMYDLSTIASLVEALTAVPAPTDAQRQRVRHMSKVVFGNRDRVEVAVAIARSADGMVNATDLSREIDLPQSRVRNQLVAMAEGELLTVFDTSDVKRWYKRRDTPFWHACVALYLEWTG